MFANITPQDKQAFFSLLDEYFASRPHLTPPSSASPYANGVSAGSSGGGGGGAPSLSLNNVSLSSLNRFMSPGPSTPPAGSPVSQKSEKDLERERKDKEKEKERMDLAMRLGKGALRASTGTARHSLNLITKSDRAMSALDKRGAGGMVRGANSMANSADGYLKGPPKNKGSTEAVVEETTVAGGPPPPPEKKKGGMAGLMSGKMTSMFKEPQKGGGQTTTVETTTVTAVQPPPQRRMAPTAAAVELEPEVASVESQAQAIYDYSGADGDLSVQSGQIVNVLEKTSTDWWTCEDGNGTRGLVPSNYLKEI